MSDERGFREKDFGGAPVRRRRVLQVLLAFLLVFIVTAAGSAPKFLQERRQAIADAQAWAITGPRCRSVTETEFRALSEKARTGFVYSDVTFHRAHGHVSCAEIRPDGGRALFGAYPVCQFTSPSVIEVKAAQGAFYFITGVGRRATVSVPRGKAECVLAGKFRG